MKKRTVLLLSLLGLTIILEACNLVSDAKEAEVRKQQAKTAQEAQVTQQTQINQQSLPSGSNTEVASQTYIGETRALEIALEHAGVNSSELLFSKSYLESDDRRMIYDVEFYAGVKEYDYEIDAVTGNILGFDADMEFDFIPPAVQNNQQAAGNSQSDAQQSNQQAAQEAVQQQTQKQEQQNAPQQNQQPVQPKTEQPASQPAPQPVQQPASSGSVSLESAKQIALNKVPGAGVDHIRIKQEWDDGRTVYEGKIIYNQMEYDFEIDAATGNITDWDAESIYD